MEHDCGKCLSAGKCTRHPKVDKSGVFGAICRGEGDAAVQKRWLDKWDIEETGKIYEPPIRKRPKASSGGGNGSCCGAVTKIVTFATAVAKWFANGCSVVPAGVAEERMEICRACPSFDNGTCSQCSCVLSLKTKSPTEQCPSSKWLQWFETSKRFETEPQRNLIYHIWPTKQTDAWQWNVEQLKRRIQLFDGVRSIAVVW